MLVISGACGGKKRDAGQGTSRLQVIRRIWSVLNDMKGEENADDEVEARADDSCGQRRE